MSYQHLLFEVENGIATITFNRPKSLNALNYELVGELDTVLNLIAADEGVRVVILTGAGDKAFVAGADINELAKSSALQAKALADRGQAILGKLQDLSIPVIAAVNGYALGGGTEMALACDFIYASDNAMFGLPEITLGLIPGYGGTQRLPRLIGLNMAKEMVFTGKMISAAEAKEIGIVNAVFEQQGLMAAVLKTAKAIASKGKVSIRAAKQVMNSGIATDLATGCRLEADAFALCMASSDAKEGTTAFLEKRKADFKGDLKE
jgi:enoyl-CoA hydratase